MEGFLCSPGNGGGGSSGGGGDKRERKKAPPSGVVPSVKSSGPNCNVPVGEPLPVILAKGTFLKFASIVIGSLIITVSGILGFYWKHHYEIVSHMANSNIHLERDQFETKKEARAGRQQIVQDLKREVQLRYREVAVQQKQQIQEIGDELKLQQRRKLNKILDELKDIRRDTRKRSRQ
jgi:hypothetical protein